MKRDWVEDGWRRFLDWLKELWGKRTDPDSATVWSSPRACAPFASSPWHSPYQTRSHRRYLRRGERDAPSVV